MLLSLLIQIPLFGIFLISCLSTYYKDTSSTNLKVIALTVTTINMILSFIIWILFDSSDKHYQFVQEHHNIAYYDVYLGLDSLSIFFVLLTTIIFPLSILSNWKSIKNRQVFFLILILLLESALLLIFLVLDVLMFYIFFESILAPLFILIGVFGSSERIRAGFYFFLYTFLGSLFMLLSIVSMLSLIGCTDFDVLSKTNFIYLTQVFMFIGIFIAFAVKTPVIYLNGWLLKAHVESPLSGSILLAAIVLKLSLYGVLRLVLPLLPKALFAYGFVVFSICVITIIYASLSTLRTIDVKELIAYSSVSHAAVYLAGIVSNTVQGIQGGIVLGLAHGFVSSGLFVTAGGVLYDRSGTRLITYYSGIAQVMPILSILYFILSLGNCGAPLTLNFVGEFMSLYGVFERSPVAGILASTSIVFSAAYTIYMFNRIVFGGYYSKECWSNYIPDVNKREFVILLVLVLFTVFLGIYPSVILDTTSYDTSYLIYTINENNSQNISYLFNDVLGISPKLTNIAQDTVQTSLIRNNLFSINDLFSIWRFFYHSLLDWAANPLIIDGPSIMFSSANNTTSGPDAIITTATQILDCVRCMEVDDYDGDDRYQHDCFHIDVIPWPCHWCYPEEWHAYNDGLIEYTNGYSSGSDAEISADVSENSNENANENANQEVSEGASESASEEISQSANENVNQDVNQNTNTPNTDEN